jgi:hypothetical protein
MPESLTHYSGGDLDWSFGPLCPAVSVRRTNHLHGFSPTIKECNPSHRISILGLFILGISIGDHPGKGR